jgi:hypothetical protein
MNNEAELQKLELRSDPSDPTKAIPLPKGNRRASRATIAPDTGTANFSAVNDFLEVPPPDESWKPDQLGDYAQDQYRQITTAERKSAIHAYRLGQALVLAKQKTPHGKWGSFLKKHDISNPTWIRAKQLFQRATKEDLLTLGLTEAYLRYGILRQPEASEDEDAESQTGEPAVMEPVKSQKATTQKVAARRSGSKNGNAKPKPTVEESPKEDGQDTGEGGGQPNAKTIFNEFVERNRWDRQRQVQTLVEFCGAGVTDVLLGEVDDVLAFTSFLQDQEKRMPPPKEDTDSPHRVLVMLGNRLKLMANEIMSVDWGKECVADYLDRLDEIAEAVELLRKEVPHA